jgi:hypothetical protein
MGGGEMGRGGEVGADEDDALRLRHARRAHLIELLEAQGAAHIVQQHAIHTRADDPARLDLSADGVPLKDLLGHRLAHRRTPSSYSRDILATTARG